MCDAREKERKDASFQESRKIIQRFLLQHFPDPAAMEEQILRRNIFSCSLLSPKFEFSRCVGMQIVFDTNRQGRQNVLNLVRFL
jgi:hypothetical protein